MKEGSHRTPEGRPNAEEGGKGGQAAGGPANRNLATLPAAGAFLLVWGADPKAAQTRTNPLPASPSWWPGPGPRPRKPPATEAAARDAPNGCQKPGNPGPENPAEPAEPAPRAGRAKKPELFCQNTGHLNQNEG